MSNKVTHSLTNSPSNVEEDPMPGAETEVEGKKFRLQGANYLLTYKTHLPKDEYAAWAESIFPKSKLVKIEIAHETADVKCPYLHSHCVLSWASRIQTENCRIFDFQDIHPHIRKLPNKKAVSDALRYISKEDTDVNYKYSITDVLLECNSKSDALVYADKWSDIPGISMAFDIVNNTYIDKSYIPPTRRKWHDELDAIISKSNKHRSIIWIYGELGGEGKTDYCTLKSVNDNAPHISCGVTMDNLANYLATWKVSTGQSFDTVCFDWVRDMNDRKSIYSMIELAKNGSYTSTKYKGARFLMNRPHVICFANFLPILAKLSKDRWQIYEIVATDSSTSTSLRTFLPESLPTDSQGNPNADQLTLRQLVLTDPRFARETENANAFS